LLRNLVRLKVLMLRASSALKFQDLPTSIDHRLIRCEGNKGRTEAGDVQVMSAGTGVRHAEYFAGRYILTHAAPKRSVDGSNLLGIMQ